MSYAARAAAASLTVFFASYLLLSSSLACVWPVVRKRTARLSANVLFGLRLTPLITSAAFATFIVVPSFLRFEPRATHETLLPFATVLACGGAIVIGVGVLSASHSIWQTARLVASWRCTETTEIEQVATATELPAATPVLFVAGIWRPKLLMSTPTRELLDEGEIAVAIRHELAHVRRRDNLKKVALRFCPFPFLAGLERRWTEATELAADDAAVIDEKTALDLASAVLKMSACRRNLHTSAIAMSLAAETDVALRTRIERLLAWTAHSDQRPNWPLRVVWAAVPFVAVALGYSSVLTCVHELTELLFR
jgi:hypothetical protein